MDEAELKFILCAKDVIRLMKISDNESVICKKEISRHYLNDRYEYFEKTVVDEAKYYEDEFLYKIVNLNSSYDLTLYLIEQKLIEKRALTDNDGKKIEKSNQEYAKANWSHVHDLVVLPIFSLLDKHKHWDFADTELISAFKNYLAHYSSPLISYLTLTPLDGLNSDIDEFHFSDVYTLVKLDNEMKSHISKYSDHGNLIHSPRELNEISSAIQSKRLKTHIGRTKDDFNLDILLLIMSIRLACKVNVFAKHSYDVPLKVRELVTPIGTWHSCTSRTSMNHVEETVTLSLAELKNAKTLFLKLSSYKRTKKAKNIINVIVNRYLSSLSKNTYEDSLIDLTICLESLLLADAREELKFRLAVRGAILIKEYSDPRETKKILSKMYDDRSKIVHSGITLSEIYAGKDGVYPSVQFRSYKDLTENIICEYLTLLNEFNSLAEINQMLDQKMLAS